MNNKLFDMNFTSEYLYMINIYYDGVIGPLVTVWLMLAVAGYFLYRRVNKAKIYSA